MAKDKKQKQATPSKGKEWKDVRIKANKARNIEREKQRQAACAERGHHYRGWARFQRRAHLHQAWAAAHPEPVQAAA